MPGFFRRNGLILVSITLSSLLFIYSTLDLLQSLSPSHATEKQTTLTQQQQTKTTAAPRSSLSRYPIFGEYVNSSSGKIPKTELNFALIGILKSSDPKESQAMIRIGNHEEKLYYLKDKLPGNATLIRILENSILLKRQGRIEKLALPKKHLNQQAKQPALHFED